MKIRKFLVVSLLALCSNFVLFADFAHCAKNRFDFPICQVPTVEIFVTYWTSLGAKEKQTPIKRVGGRKVFLNLEDCGDLLDFVKQVQSNFLLPPDFHSLRIIVDNQGAADHLSKMVNAYISRDFFPADQGNSSLSIEQAGASRLQEDVSRLRDEVNRESKKFLTKYQKIDGPPLMPLSNPYPLEKDNILSKSNPLFQEVPFEKPSSSFIHKDRIERRRSSEKPSTRFVVLEGEGVLETLLVSPVHCKYRPIVDSLMMSGINTEEKWTQIKFFEAHNLGYFLSQLFVFFFQNLECLEIDNKKAKPLHEDMAFNIDHLKSLRFIKLSYDPRLFVKSYDTMVRLNPGMNFKHTLRKVISGPLFCEFEEGETPLPALGHPLLYDNSGFAPGLAERTQKIFGTIPNGDRYIQVEFFGANHLTAIDFSGLPVTESFLESLLQARITTTLDAISDWGQRLCWANKFVALEWLDLSHSSINDLTVVRNLQRLQFLRLSDTAILDLTGLRSLHRLTTIEAGISGCSLLDSARGSVNFWKLSIFNFGRLKHNLRVLMISGVVLGAYTFNAFIRALLKEEVAEIYAKRRSDPFDGFEKKFCLGFNRSRGLETFYSKGY